jgi:hypothetical protein
VKFLKKLKDDKKLPAFDALASELLLLFPAHLPLLKVPFRWSRVLEGDVFLCARYSWGGGGFL